MLFDAHTHLNEKSLTPEEYRDTVAAIEASEVDYVVDIGFDAQSSEIALEHAEKYPWCYATVGCHPLDAANMSEQQLARIKEMAQHDKVVAIGETGIDYHRDEPPKEAQREWFRRQIRLALELKMPLVIHSREADGEVMDILKDEGAFSKERKSSFPMRPDTTGYVGEGECEDARVVLHCFSGSAELAKQYVKLGATISVTGNLTFKSNKKTRAVVAEIPLDFLLVETDAPFLTPEPHRGKRNKSPYVEYVAAKMAEIKGVSYETVAAKTKENAMRFYGIPG